MIMRGQDIYSSQDEPTISPSSSESEEAKGKESSEEIYPQEDGQPLVVKEKCKEVSVSSKRLAKKETHFTIKTNIKETFPLRQPPHFLFCKKTLASIVIPLGLEFIPQVKKLLDEGLVHKSLNPCALLVPKIGVEGRSLEYKEPWDLRSNPFQGGGDDAILPPRVLDRRLQETWARATKEGVKVVISSIDGRLQSLDALDRDECETALESLGHMGSYIQGATLLLSGSSPAARHVIDAAFEGQGPTGHGKQLFSELDSCSFLFKVFQGSLKEHIALKVKIAETAFMMLCANNFSSKLELTWSLKWQSQAALHALGNISGKTRSENSIILNAEAEVNLRRLIYETASRSTKLTPSGLFLSVLQQDSEMRLAGYRMLSELVARPWCLMEICSKQEIINKVTDPSTETTKIGMEGRYDCCKAIHKSLTVSSRVSANPAFAGIAAKNHGVAVAVYSRCLHRPLLACVVRGAPVLSIIARMRWCRVLSSLVRGARAVVASAC
ncbi:hypothetical protein D0Y65_034555 [Glycine soja]|uniref:Uncharacterized protein n=1 Tax=Glycine soja TaxID=3848 RepID=A0A445HR08_GLYSO|nr:hypothetical protein D0Y65_034555 [Glycine soja]